MNLVEFLLARIAEDEAAADTTHYQYCGVNDDMGPTKCDCGIPARLLAECDAKRRIIAIAAEVIDLADVMLDVLKALALPYADHANYRVEWRP